MHTILQNIRIIALFAACGCTATAISAQAQQEQVITVPGFADFLACLDGAPRARDNHGRKCNIGCGRVFGLFDAGVSRWP